MYFTIQILSKNYTLARKGPRDLQIPQLACCIGLCLVLQLNKSNLNTYCGLYLKLQLMKALFS